MEEDLDHLRFNIYNYLKPMRKAGRNRQFRFPISIQLYDRLRLDGLNGGFKSAYLIKSYNLPIKRQIRDEKSCSIDILQARISKPRRINEFVSKPSMTVRYIFKFTYD